MLSGSFENCYGIKKLELKEINFDKSNKAMIYAPNGVMKSSFSQVFDDISKGLKTVDRIFTPNVSSYKIKYHSDIFSNEHLSKNDKIFVVKSPEDSFEVSNETISTLLADKETKKRYDVLLKEFKEYIDGFVNEFCSSSGLSKTRVRSFLMEKLELEDKSDWTDIFLKLNDLNKEIKPIDKLASIKYTDVINDKTEEILKDEEFLQKVEEYVVVLEKLMDDNELLSKDFNDYNAEALGDSFDKNNLFAAKHTIVLKDGITIIDSLDKWKDALRKQLDKIYSNDELGRKFTKIKNKLNKNEQTRRLKQILQENMEIIEHLIDLNKLTKQFIVTYINKMDKNFDEYFNNTNLYAEEMKKIYEKADQQSERWKKIIEEFNLRFKVPFEVRIDNKANLLLKNEAPKLFFVYTRCKENPLLREEAVLGKNELIVSLSRGEKRAMYLLYMLFDIEIIKDKAASGNEKYLIIVDDIADSFDYKNKYAIIEYLADISNSKNIDLLILTHNFDFYRTAYSRIDIERYNCFIVQKNEKEELEMEEFKYLNDYFLKGIVLRNTKWKF